VCQLFGNGHYFGCLAQVQALLETVIRHVCQIMLSKKPNHDWSFANNLEALHKKKFIADDWKTTLDQIRADRQSFHCLQAQRGC
jgi:hypothetical protein